MRVVALISGGKDSCFNMMQCVAESHDLVALVNLYPHHVDELDSYMFQTVGHHAIDLYSQAMGLPLYRAPIKGGSVEQGRDYHPTAGDEVEDLYQILKKVKEDLQIEAVSVGAILSNYQRVRVENVCLRLGLTSLAYLWRRDQTELLGEMIDADIHAIIIKVAALGLTAKHLGKSIKEIQPHMEAMKNKYQLNVCGEGGEYETFTLDCPLFSKRIVIDDFQVVQHDEDDISPVFYIHFNKMHLAAKDKIVEEKSFAERIRDIKMKRGKSLCSDLDIPDLTPSKNSALEYPIINININCPFNEELETCQPPLCNHGNQGFAWVSGVRASSETNCGSDSSVLQSTEVAMETLKAQLQSQGYGLQDAVLVHLYVRDMADFAHINSIYCKYFSLNPPARVCVQASLPEGTVLQLDCLAHHTPSPQGQGRVDEDRDPAHYRTTMHVQGLSHWAPANIGPYSQAVQIGNLVFCAGIIALCPSSMRMIEGGINAESRLSLRSVARVLAAMQRGLGLRDVVAATCYLTQLELEGTARNHWLRSLEEETVEHQELCGEHPSIPCLVNYVVVPSLPRGALVEWHVVAATDKHTWQYSEAVSSEESVTVELKVAWCSQSGAAFISARVDPQPNTTEINLHSAVKALVSAVSMDMSSRGWDTGDILSFKVFHDQSEIPQSRISTALRAELTQGRDRPVNFTSLPVKSLPPPCILDVCVWVQAQPSPTNDDADL
ncbi:uncharacterized protein [Diadema antillarum]|uniref:uncharacterized protein n=1 Tax=Diadema antillarum TaxID=105358 RepID=UPI003A846A4F